MEEEGFIERWMNNKQNKRDKSFRFFLLYIYLLHMHSRRMERLA